MKGDLGTILYVVFLIIISLAGVFRKKKKADAEVLKKRMMREESPEVSFAEAEEEEGYSTGNPLVDTLLNRQEEQEYSSVEKEMPATDPFLDTSVNVWKTEEEPEEFLPLGEEGKSVFLSKEQKKTKPEDKDRIVADHPDWQKFLDEQNEETRPDIMEDFDPVKAVIYSEIMERKYF